VTDSSNWEQLGIARYVKNFTPVEQLQFVACKKVTGEELCGKHCEIIGRRWLRHSDVQIYDYGMLEIWLVNKQDVQHGFPICRQMRCIIIVKAIILILLCKSCRIKEVHLMFDSLTQLGIFFSNIHRREVGVQKRQLIRS